MTSTGMGARPTEVVKECLVGTAGLLQCVGKQRQLVPAAAVVDGPRQLRGGTVIVSKYGRPEVDWLAEGVAQDVADQGALLRGGGNGLYPRRFVDGEPGVAANRGEVVPKLLDRRQRDDRGSRAQGLGPGGICDSLCL